MRWLDALWRREPALDSGQRAALEAYRSQEEPDLRVVLAAQRMVVVDVETSGLDPFSDRLLSIGAVAVGGGLVRFDESLEVVLQQARPSDTGNILIHGIGGSAQLGGREPVAGLLDFLTFAGKAPLVGFNVGFDRIVIERATSSVLGMKPDNIWLDLAVLLPSLFPPLAPVAHTLDDWTGVFGIDNYSRHDAVADALATAQLWLVVMAHARKEGIKSCADLIRAEKGLRWLGHH